MNKTINKTMNNFPQQIRIVEVGPRDGLQNEKQAIGTATKVELIERLVDAGLHYIEAGSFVNPKWVPQMAASEEVFMQLKRKQDVTYAALTPNLQGFERARSVNVTEVAMFAAASESFSKKNINCSIAESIERFTPVIAAAKADNIPVRGYVSCVAGCPYEGEVDPEIVRQIAVQLIAMGCYEVSLGDTIGVATAGNVKHLLETIAKDIPVEKLAVHFHDTYGQALTNIYAALQMGIQTIDSSVAGLGGCPYAASPSSNSASGNVATEDVIYLLNGLNIQTGVDLEKLIVAGNFISATLGRDNPSKVARALTVPKAFRF
ncbi:MAG: hydroxymethylglutaryl-CoA lyase [Pseudomonadales bacterium]